MGLSSMWEERWERAMEPVRKAQVSIVSVPLLRAKKRLATYLPLHRQAALVAGVLPRAAWYAAALRIARAQGALVERMGGNGALSTVLMLDHWMRELSFHGTYPFPYRTQGLELSLAPGPKILCWTHVPLVEVALRALLDAGGAPVAVVSDPGKIVGDNGFQVFGWAERMEALPADSTLLSRVKRTIRSGKSVIFLADPYLGGPMSDAPVRMAGMLRVPLLFQWPELQPDGSFEVFCREPPFLVPRTEAEVAANVAFLREARDRKLRELGWGVLPA